MSLRELDAEDLPDELGVADLRREAEEGGSLLRVECRRERRAGQRQQRLDVLARRVQQLRATVVRQLPRERAAVRDRKRVDEDNLAADRGLDQAELREVGALANELGIDGERRRGRPRIDASGERRGVADWSIAAGHRHLIMRMPPPRPKAS